MSGKLDKLQRRWNATDTIIIIILSFSAVSLKCLAHSEVLQTFNGNLSLRTFVYSEGDHAVYVGSVNAIYRLTKDLQLNGSVTTGPANDITQCRDSSFQVANCDRASASSPNINQALALDINSNTLIACGTLYFGSCVSLSLKGFSSSVNMVTYRPVVPTDESVSVAVLVAPGPDERTNALFVASAYSHASNNSAVQNQRGFLAVRKIPSFELSHIDESSSSVIHLRAEYLAKFNIIFRRAIYLSDHVYIFIVRSKTLSSPLEMTSHVLRLCTNDRKLHSLVERQLECKVNGVVYPYLRDMTILKIVNQMVVDNGRLKLQGDMLFGAFTTTTANAGDSAVCAYRLSDIRNSFLDTIQGCFNGQGFKGPEYLALVEPCIQTNVAISHSFCGDYSYNHPIYSNASFTAAFGTVVNQTTITRLQMRNANNVLYSLMGTSDGMLLKAVIATNQSLRSQAAVYARIKLDSGVSPVKDIVVANNSTIYLLTDSAVKSVRLYNCSALLSCTECVPDPHCAWCLQSNRCMEISACLSPKITTRCPKVLQYTPNLISGMDYKNTSIQLTLDWIPPTFTRINCMIKDNLSSYKDTSLATVTDTPDGNRLVSCHPFTTLPTFSLKSIFLNLSLALTIQELAWSTVPITAYSCDTRKNCMACTEANSMCSWCVVTHRCLPAAKPCGSLAVYSVNMTSRCPSVNLSSDYSSIPSGKTVNLTINGYNLLEIHRVQGQLKCQFTTAIGAVMFPASFNMLESVAVAQQATIVCREVKLTYDNNSPRIQVPLVVLWNIHQLDHLKPMRVELYKCQHLVSNCGQCVTLDAKYGCGWCRDHCSLIGDCTSGLLPSNETCPNAKILSFTPSGGPVKGRTKLQVFGENLGRTGDQMDVTVGGKKCNVIADDFVPTVSFSCITHAVESPVDSFVEVTVGKYSARSSEKFVYADPYVSSWTPGKGPCSGGTLVTVNGSNLNFGSDVRLTLSDSPAQILRRTSTSLEFITPRQSSPMTAYILMKIDESPITIQSPGAFYYVEDPTIHLIDPVTSVMSGGNKIDVRGKSLNSVPRPLFVIYHGNTNLTAPCNATASSTFMICQTPSLNQLGNLTASPLNVEYGLIMDDVMQLRKLNSQSYNSYKSFTYIQDPKIYPFQQTVAYVEGMKLSVDGENLDLYKQFKDMEITIGGVSCQIVVVLSDKKMTCDPPAADSRLIINDGMAQITFKLGNYVKDIGYMSYYERMPSYGLIFGLIFGIFFAIVVIAVITYLICMWRKKQVERKPRQLVSVSPRSRSEPSNNQYSASETVPLQVRNNLDNASPRDEEVTKDDAHYFQELLKKIENPRIRNAAKEVYIARERLEIGAMLGKGHFGCVYAATLRDPAMKNPVAVAVKTIEDSDLDQKMVENFVQEGIIMKNFNHPHVLSLLGLCLGYRKEPMVILPFMANGDLRTFVKDKSRMFTARQLLQLAQQVAEGMSYLSSLNFVHRDLAARNCMIDDKNQVKVADFGLSRELFERQYYSSKDHRAKLPVKWMALESLEDFIFTAKSDVWSFGILMWELMTRGVTPYPDVEVSEMRTYLSSGRRLRKPKYCPENVYAIMTECWHKIPERRPTFTDLVNKLELLLNPPKKNRSVTREPEEEPTYINVADQEAHDYLHPVSDSSTAANA